MQNFSSPPRKKDYLAPVLIVGALAVIALLAVRLISQLMGNPPLSGSSPTAAELTVLAGEAEVYLPESDAWKIANRLDLSLTSGERLRTGPRWPRRA